MRTEAPEGWVSTTDLMVLTGITYRQADYWTRLGWLRPPQPTPGSGAQRYYSPREQRVAAIMAALVTAGVDPGAAALAARTSWGGRWWRVVLDGGVQACGRLPDGLEP